MKAPTLRSADEWRKLYPGVKALILSPSRRDASNASFLLSAAEPAPEGRFRFLGYID